MTGTDVSASYAAPAVTSAALPAWTSVLAVVAHPDDESFGLGAVLDAFTSTGASGTVLCLTHGEASTLHGVAGDLHAVREAELTHAAEILGVTRTVLRDFPDGALADVTADRLSAEVVRVAAVVEPDGLLVFDPSGVTGHPDHVTATAAALAAAEALGLPVLGWTLPEPVAAVLNDERGTSFVGHAPADIDCVVPVDRTRQRRAIAAHASQALPASVLWRRLELLGDTEHVRLLNPGTRAGRTP